jgi:hypothetical protein
MAIQEKRHGDFKPVMNFDARSYTVGAINAVESGKTVQPQGPKLDFGTITFTGAATPTGADLKKAIDTIQQLAVVYVYEFTEVGNNTDTLAVAVYPTGAWNFANEGDLDDALTAALGYAVTTAATATFSN